MDEILFRLSSQLEALQIQCSVTSQQTQQILCAWLAQSYRLLQNLLNDLHGQEVKEVFQKILSWFQQQTHILHYHLSSIRFNSEYIQDQIGKLNPLDLSRREYFYFFSGLMVGSFIGYSVALKWNVPQNLRYMKAIVCQNYLGIESVSLIEDAIMPTIQKSNELLIHVRAASIHEIDIRICSGYSRIYRRLLNTGKYRDLPVTLGRDCAGIVIAIGQKVNNFDTGDEVFLAVPSWSSGTMAEYIVVPETRVAKMPKILPFEAATSLPYSGCIALDALINHSIIKEDNAEGQRVLVYGGSTPVGCILIQLIKLWGGYTVTVCKSEAAPIVQALGANDVILLNESDVLKQLEVRDKYDAIFYTGGQYLGEKILKKFLLPNGSYVSTVPEYLISDSLGYISGSLFSAYIRIRLLFQFIFGVNCNWREESKLDTAYLKSLQKLADTKQLRPILGRVYTPDCIDQALSDVKASNAIGSAVIKFQ